MKIETFFKLFLIMTVLVIDQVSFGMKKESMPLSVCQAPTLWEQNFDKFKIEAAAFDPENRVLLKFPGGCVSYDIENKNFAKKDLGDDKSKADFIEQNSARSTRVGTYTLCYGNEHTGTCMMLGNKVTIEDIDTKTPLYTINHDNYIKYATFNADHTKLVTVSNGNKVKVSAIKKPIIVNCNKTFIVCDSDIACMSQLID